MTAHGIEARLTTFGIRLKIRETRSQTLAKRLEVLGRSLEVQESSGILVILAGCQYGLTLV